MSTIRPTLTPPPAPTPSARAADAARLAAQKAFFQIATGEETPPAAAPIQARAAVPAAPPAARAAQAESPARSLRPGSLLDIRV